MVIEKGKPELSKMDSLEETKQLVNEVGSADESEIKVPEIDSQYAEISCDRIALSAPVYYGDSDADLQKGVGHSTQSFLPGEGKPILIGGHDGTFFAPLEQIKTGDEVKITTDYGEFQYNVVGIKIAESTDTNAYNLNQDKEELILYTCYPFGKLAGDRGNRYFVYCEKVSGNTKVIE
jgi:LPXTG-site transpeptidase (sortase) family protein